MSFYFSEEEELGSRLTFTVEDHLFSGRSDFQKLDIFQTKSFGRAMVLDGYIMVTERDEFVYHDMITHVPLYTHPNPEKILVIGGGDGGTIREAARHDKVKEIHICEIDGLVIEKSKELLPTMGCGYDNPKVSVFVEDGVKFVKDRKKEYDVVLIDSTDPIGPGEGLFNQSFYDAVYDVLKDDGLMAVQSESPMYTPELVRDIADKTSKRFKLNRMYLAFTPTYPSGNWSFMLASKKYDPLIDFDSEAFKLDGLDFKYYNEGIHKASFVLPNYAKKIMSS